MFEDLDYVSSYKMEDPSGEYSISFLLEMPSEYLLGDVNNPGPLVALAYPEVLRMREVHRKFRDIIDTDYFWELKTRRDFGAEDLYPEKGNWKEEYLSYGEERASELLEASKDGNATKVRELLDLGVNPNSRDKHRWTPLTLASRFRHADVVKILLEAEADVDARIDENERTALMVASEIRFEEPEDSLEWIVLSRDPEIVQMLLDRGAEVDARDERGRTAMYDATKGATSVDADGSATRWSGNAEIVQMLLDRGADANVRTKNGYIPLLGADLEVARLLLDRGADVNFRTEDGRTALFGANLDVDVARLLLDRGAEVDAQDVNERTPLMEAVDEINSEFVRVLLDRGANIRLRDKWGDTAVDIALASYSRGYLDNEREEIIKMLAKEIPL